MKNLWRELFSEFKLQHTTTPLYNPSSNPVEFFHWTLTAMLRTQGPGVQESWDLKGDASKMHTISFDLFCMNLKN